MVNMPTGTILDTVKWNLAFRSARYFLPLNLSPYLNFMAAVLSDTELAVKHGGSHNSGK